MARFPFAGVICGLCYLASLASPCGAAEINALHSAVQSINATEAKAHVDVLADDTFEGREAGTRGGRAAAGYLARLLQRHGLEGGAAGGGYFQSFDRGYRNILALLPGGDPQLKHEVVVVGAHYDHVGYGTPTNSYGPWGYIHNGADDNASGVAGMLEVIEAFKELPSAPKRTVLFAFWDGEEKGLLGSKHWVAHPTAPLENIAVMLNMDMIGRLRNDTLTVYGTRTGQGLRRLVSEQNMGLRMRLKFTWELKENSDHWPFFSKGAPVLMFHTGLHDDYHRPRDDAHLINNAGIQQVARLVFYVAHRTANEESRLLARPEATKETPKLQKQFEQALAPMPPRLGVSWQPEPHPEGGLLVTHVRQASAAAIAGVQVGDRIISLNEAPITDGGEFHRAVLAAESQVKLTVSRPGHSEPLPLNVALSGNPARMGISWRVDASEPGTLTIVRVIGGSAAARAGLVVGDRIYQVDGQDFSDDDAFVAQVARSQGEITLLIERSGRIGTVELDLPDQAAGAMPVSIVDGL